MQVFKCWRADQRVAEHIIMVLRCTYIPCMYVDYSTYHVCHTQEVNARLSEESARQSDDLQAAVVQHEELHNQHMQLTALHANLSNYHTSLQEEHASLQAAHTGLQEQVAQLQETAAQLQGALEAAASSHQVEVGELNEKAAGLEGQIEGLAAQISELKAHVASLEARDQALEEQLAEAAASKGALEEQLAETAASKQALEEQLAKTAASHQALEASQASELQTLKEEGKLLRAQVGLNSWGAQCCKCRGVMLQSLGEHEGGEWSYTMSTKLAPVYIHGEHCHSLCSAHVDGFQFTARNAAYRIAFCPLRQLPASVLVTFCVPCFGHTFGHTG